MPIYEYKCPKCNFSEEKIVPYERSKEQRLCPKCLDAWMERTLGNIAHFTFKGNMQRI